jgi:hypothetical protein
VAAYLIIGQGLDIVEVIDSHSLYVIVNGHWDTAMLLNDLNHVWNVDAHHENLTALGEFPGLN